MLTVLLLIGIFGYDIGLRGLRLTYEADRSAQATSDINALEFPDVVMLEYASFSEFCNKENVGDSIWQDRAGVHQPGPTATTGGAAMTIVLPDGTVVLPRRNATVVHDAEYVGLIISECGPIEIERYDYDGDLDWRVSAGEHAHAFGLLSGDKVIVYEFENNGLWDSGLGLSTVRIFNWDNGNQVRWLHAAIGLSCIAMDRSGQYLYLCSSRGDTYPCTVQKIDLQTQGQTGLVERFKRLGEMAKQGRTDGMKAVLASINGGYRKMAMRHIARVSLSAGHVETIDYLVRECGYDDYTHILWLASKLGNSEVAHYALAHGATIGSDSGSTVLCDLLWHDNADAGLIAELIAKGADVNAREDIAGYSPLQLAAQAGNSEIVSLLLAAGANLNATDKRGNTALLSVRDGARGDQQANQVLAITRRLLAAGINVNAQDVQGESALIHTMRFSNVLRQYEIARMLVEHGANVNAYNHYHGTVLDVARQREHPNQKIVDWLIVHGAKSHTELGLVLKGHNEPEETPDPNLGRNRGR